MRHVVFSLAGILLILAAIGAPAPAWAFEEEYGESPEASVAPAFSDLASAEDAAAASDWLEPRGLNIVDLVGWVPESDLAGAIIQYTPGYGILRYQSGSRAGNTVTITATAYPRFYTDPHWSGSLFGCLGQPARSDELGSVAPETTLRVFAPDGREVTRQVSGYYYVPAGLTKPIRNPYESLTSGEYRYWETGLREVSYGADGALLLPANMGCELLIWARDYRELTLVFKAEIAPAVAVQVLGRDAFQFPVYFGPGFAGHLDGLRSQLIRACTATPAEVSDMTIPPGADYFFFNFPAAPVDAYTTFPYNPLGNIDRPTGATYRIRTARGLSVDHVTSAGLPLYSHWVDMDQALNTQYLPYTRQVVAFEGLESLLPPGISYDPCMAAGNCPAAKLAEICSTAISASMIYLRVEKIQPGLHQIPLQMPGPEWCNAGATAIAGTAPAASLDETPSLPRKIYLASVAQDRSSTTPDDPTGCSINGGCGWFTSDGRMVDYIPVP